jgi:hypothetical protein
MIGTAAWWGKTRKISRGTTQLVRQRRKRADYARQARLYRIAMIETLRMHHFTQRMQGFSRGKRRQPDETRQRQRQRNHTSQRASGCNRHSTPLAFSCWPACLSAFAARLRAFLLSGACICTISVVYHLLAVVVRPASWEIAVKTSRKRVVSLYVPTFVS